MREGYEACERKNCKKKERKVGRRNFGRKYNKSRVKEFKKDKQRNLKG